MKTTENYFAIRIGSPSKHHPYFYTEDGEIPKLFKTRKIAQGKINEMFRDQKDIKAVPVRVQSS